MGEFLVVSSCRVPLDLDKVAEQIVFNIGGAAKHGHRPFEDTPTSVGSRLDKKMGYPLSFTVSSNNGYISALALFPVVPNETAGSSIDIR